MIRQWIIITILFSLSFIAYGQHSSSIDQNIHNLLNSYLNEHQNSELLTGISANIKFEKLNKNYYVGKVSKDKNAAPVSANTLFGIGSITKSFTSAIILQLEAEGVLNIEQTLKDWLPEYPRWKNVKIKQLLNMTSGIPDYLSNKQFINDFTQNIQRQWTKKEIVDVVYQSSDATKGFDYSNTNYMLLAMIIEKATKHSFTEEMNKRLIKKLNLNNTFYFEGPIDKQVMARLARGYYYGKKIGALNTGTDVTNNNMSWAGPAGALISNPEEVSRFVKALITGKVLPPKQTLSLKNLISTKTTQPIQKTTKADPFGFGLGIMEVYHDKISIWDYEGVPAGYRTMYVMPHCGDMVITVAVNSSPLTDISKDDLNQLVFKLYKIAVQANPGYQCNLP